MEMSKMGADLWRKHNGEVSLWTVSAGEMGNWLFVIKFTDYEAYGACMNELTQDADFLAFQNKFMTSSKADWVRSNVVRQIPI
jgi:hypothetical protein